jgi:hypothetical protein
MFVQLFFVRGKNDFNLYSYACLVDEGALLLHNIKSKIYSNDVLQLIVFDINELIFFYEIFIIKKTIFRSLSWHLFIKNGSKGTL